jgi:hypothetical protein
VVSELRFVDLESELNPRSSENCKSKIFKVARMESSFRIEIEKFNG